MGASHTNVAVGIADGGRVGCSVGDVDGVVVRALGLVEGTDVGEEDCKPTFTTPVAPRPQNPDDMKKNVPAVVKT